MQTVSTVDSRTPIGKESAPLPQEIGGLGWHKEMTRRGTTRKKTIFIKDSRELSIN